MPKGIVCIFFKMGQNQSVFVYNPLKYVEYIKTLDPNISNKLESFVLQSLVLDHKIEIDQRWRQIVQLICHKIKCVSEGWTVLPTIHFTVDEKGIVCIKKIKESV